MTRFQAFLLCAFVLFLGVATIEYARGANIAILNPAGPIAAEEKNIIIITFLLSGLVVVPVFVLLFYFAWKYRASSPEASAAHSPDWDHDSAIAEFFWWLVPAFIILVLGIIAWRSSYALDPYKPLQSDVPPVAIYVVALDWKWLFIYPEQGIASVNLVEFPVGTPVHFYLTSDAPMNTFWIPQLAGQIMVMPGMTTQLNLAADTMGDFSGSSGNISGKGFAGMTFVAKSVSQSDFAAWVNSVKAASSSALSMSSYAALEAPSEYVPVSYYGSVDQGLFAGIESKYGNEDASSSAHMNP